jgi:hypothetical protein
MIGVHAFFCVHGLTYLFDIWTFSPLTIMLSNKINYLLTNFIRTSCKIQYCIWIKSIISFFYSILKFIELIQDSTMKQNLMDVNDFQLKSPWLKSIRSLYFKFSTPLFWGRNKWTQENRSFTINISFKWY